MKRVVLSALLLVITCTAGGWSANATAATVSPRIEDFSLVDYRGKTWSLRDFNENQAIVVAFLGTECPLAKLYTPRLIDVAEKYREKGVAVIAVDANQQDSLAEIAHFARINKVEFPLLKDAGNAVADQFDAQRTPEVFLLDKNRAVRYRGRIDDQYTYGIQKPEVSKNYLTDALDELLAGNLVTTPQTETVGCFIGRVLKSQGDGAVTYSRQISRLLQQRCVECHRDGEIAPFALTDYDEVVGWAEMIEEVVDQRRMPPWNADPNYGHFRNDARLTDDELDLIHRWVAAGAPEGDPAELPPPRTFDPDWKIGQPDLVISMSDKPYAVPATGEVKYQYFMVDPGFTEDKWIKAAECQPGNRSVVHHMIVAIPGERRGLNGDLASEWLAAMAPGASPMMLPDGMAKKIPAGSKLVFQMHYTPNGTAQQDCSRIGLIFADLATVRQQVATRGATNRNFAIPPGAENHEVESSFTFAQDSLVLAMFPHMHLRGKSFRYTAEYPGGETEVLLDVPAYDFNWQNSYLLAEPKRMPAGTKLHCVAHFDNSEDNLANPDPTATVRWGDQTWEEMMIGYFDMVLTDQDLTKQAQSTRTAKFLQDAQASTPQPSELLKTLAAGATSSDKAMVRFALVLQAAAPQLDRVCWTSIADGKLTIRRVAQMPEYAALVGGAGLSVPAQGTALESYLEKPEVVVHQDLHAATEGDLRFMARAFNSSMHVPVKLDGVAGTINFWSTEPSAFPPEAVAFLQEVARLIQ